ncbi:hypothetical protein PIB30_036905 [Stylosanthes scabra]|uniref:Uncharacterized protein n=1 Tax=Stylosanthes scabra TaxID=79078 RepID=A0ABU6ZAF5_9FABA|nr:hypothetical protein [Stylosanthes scabra]
MVMHGFHATYRFNINQVPSEEYWTTTTYLRTDPPIIKRPIRRPKVQSRKRDPVEVLIEGDKLKNTFKADGGGDSWQEHSTAHNQNEVANTEGPSNRFRVKQPIRRCSQRSSSQPHSNICLTQLKPWNHLSRFHCKHLEARWQALRRKLSLQQVQHLKEFGNSCQPLALTKSRTICSTSI